MAKFKYVGDHEEVTIAGVAFKRGEVTDVPDEMVIVTCNKDKPNKNVVEMLKGHPEFEEEKPSALKRVTKTEDK